jgi:hypothetical protein
MVTEEERETIRLEERARITQLLVAVQRHFSEQHFTLAMWAIAHDKTIEQMADSHGHPFGPKVGT